MRKFRFIVISEVVQEGTDANDAAIRLRKLHFCVRSNLNPNGNVRLVANSDQSITEFAKADFFSGEEVKKG